MSFTVRSNDYLNNIDIVLFLHDEDYSITIPEIRHYLHILFFDV